ncbi:M23 family metallopeptidase [Pseudovibrio sp. Tun.PSC04-5.I4]|uniref:M23 family metallopeptidase n=1 Tax=Pseudovibrio sp. Tun.PSC04-5.I4 TaxID=1798213 RepID=UPI001AD9209B|nr:M23 family metallopeptidase [Pseudovibrio sp. Tun.PSC04-5.I4]
MVDSLASSSDQPTRLNGRWLIGTILTGMTSIILMGGALMAALDGQYTFTEAKAPSDKSADFIPQRNSGGKGDRFSAGIDGFSNRQVIEVNTVTRTDGRDHVKSKPYALVTASLSNIKKQETAADIPPFDPISMYQGEQVAALQVASDAIYGADIEGEVSISQRDFPLEAMGMVALPDHKEEAVQEQVKKAAMFMTDNSIDIAAIPSLEDFNAGFAPLSEQSFENIQVRITEENVSFQPKSRKTTQASQIEERIVPILTQTDFIDVLLDGEASEREAEGYIQAFTDNYGIKSIKSGQIFRLSLNTDQLESVDGILVRVSIYENQRHIGTIARTDEGEFVVAPEPSSEMVADAFASQKQNSSGPRANYYNSIYQTGLENEVPQSLIKELVRIYSYSVDFNAPVKAGDEMSVFYGLEADQNNGASEILYTSIVVNGRTYRFYRFRTPDDGVVDYYDENGQSAKQFLLRKPIASGRFTSGFGMRRHPILKTRRLHTGTDWAAPRGTPILAAGDGVIQKAAWSGGYGKRVEIKHSNGYVTTYNHMTRFAKGIKKDGKIRQGSVIGYVGTTGLSTGNHLHYEVKVNGRFVNSLKIKVPQGRILEAKALTTFKSERDRINALMETGRSGQRVASLGN